MASQELIDFIKKQRERGVTPTDIEKALQEVGWAEQDVQEGLSAAGIGMSPKPSGLTAAPSPLSSPGMEPTQAKPVAAQSEKEPVDVFAEVDDGAGSVTGAAAITPVTSMTPEQQAATPKNSAPMTAAQHAAAPAAVEYQEGMSLKKKIAVFIAIILAVAVIVAGAVFAYFRFYQSPARVGTLLIGNIVGLTSAHVEVGIDQSLKSGSTVMEKNTTTINGDTTLFASTQPEASLNVQWKQSDGEDATDAGMNFKSSGGMSYVQITSFEGSGEGTSGSEKTENVLLDILDQQWVEVNSQDTELASFFPNALVSTTGTLTPEEQGVVRDAFRDASVVRITEKIDTAVIESIKTYHYRFEVDKEELKQLIGVIAPVLKAHGYTDTSINVLVKSVDSWNSIGGELWVGAKNYQLYRVEITATGTRSANRTEEWKATMKLSNHNQPVTVEVPTDAMTVQEFVEAVAAAAAEEAATDSDTNTTDTETSDTTTPDADGTPEDTEQPKKKKDADDDGLTDAEEADYGTNATDPDSDGDGFLDGEEVDNGYNPLGAGKL